MFSTPTPTSPSMDEGIVVQVDVLRKMCRVKTLRGQNLDQVQWTNSSGGSSRAGSRESPSLGDRVVIEYGLGYPLITGYLDRFQSDDNTFPLHIDSGSTLVDTGNYSSAGGAIVGDANKPGDILSGDKILTSEGGGFIGALRAGTVILRSSRLAQVIISKLDDVVKVVSRNWEHYTDVCSDIVKNLRGRVYRYTGYSNSYAEAKNEAYRYHLYYGDVALAEAVKTQFLNTPVNNTKSNILFKEQVTNGSEKMHRTLNINGEEEVLITSAGGLTRKVSTGDQISLSYGDINTILINNPEIKLVRSDGATITMTSSGITLEFQGGVVTMQNDGIRQTFGGHYINLTSGGISLG